MQNAKIAFSTNKLLAKLIFTAVYKYNSIFFFFLKFKQRIHIVHNTQMRETIHNNCS